MATLTNYDAAELIAALINTPVLNDARDNATGIADYLDRASDRVGALSTGERALLDVAVGVLAGTVNLERLRRCDAPTATAAMGILTRWIVGN